MKYLKELSVSEKQILDVLELKKIEDIDLDKLSTLRGMVTLIKNGESTVSDLFVKDKDVAIEDLELLYDIKKESLSEEERKGAERIISNKETTSYSKLLKLLQSK